MADPSEKHKSIRTDFTDPSPGAVAITPSDTVAISIAARAIYVGGTGDIAAVMADGSEVTFVAVPVGIFPIQVQRIDATNTTATDMIALK